MCYRSSSKETRPVSGLGCRLCRVVHSPQIVETMSTMVAHPSASCIDDFLTSGQLQVKVPYVNHVATLTGGVGHDDLTRFYKVRTSFLRPSDISDLLFEVSLHGNQCMDSSDSSVFLVHRINGESDHSTRYRAYRSFTDCRGGQNRRRDDLQGDSHHGETRFRIDAPRC